MLAASLAPDSVRSAVARGRELTSSDHWVGRGMYKYHSHTENIKEKNHWAKPWMNEMHTGK